MGHAPFLEQSDQISPDYRQMRRVRARVKGRAAFSAPLVALVSEGWVACRHFAGYHIGMTEAVPRHAASLIIVRRDAAGMQVLMGHRSAGHRFMPNALVFPGGAVDPADFAAPVAAPLRAEVAARVQRAASDELAQALGVAACRELTEEVGLSLGAPPRLDQLSYLCRAITPADRPIRFDARFFVVPASAVTGTVAASRELEAPAWYGIEAALVSGAVTVTQAVLRQLCLWADMPHAANGPVPVLRERAWVDE